MVTIKVLKTGLFTTVQDLGRHGFRKYGITVGGAMDRLSLRAANILVGNAEDEAGLEMTLTGPVLCFNEDAWIAITGSDFSPSINGHPVPMRRPVLIKKGSILEFRASQNGRLAYLGLAGGIQVPKVMDSKSTYTQAGIGGYFGRALAKGDLLPIRSHEIRYGFEKDFASERWGIGSNVLPSYTKEKIIHITEGPEFGLFPDTAHECLFNSYYCIGTESNRMGYRLQGPSLNYDPKDMLSSPVAPGTIQVPPDGQPIILMADCQTTGGYPRIGHVIQTDLPKLAQAKPGDRIRFKLISMNEAHRRLFKQEKVFRLLKKAVQMRCQYGSNGF